MRRVFLATIGLLLFVLLTPSLFAAITDTFTGADGSSLGAGWASNEGTAWTIQGNKAAPVNSGFSSMIRAEVSFPNDQYAQLVTRATDVGNTAYGSAIVRASGTTYYECRILSGSVFLRKSVAGVDSYLNDALSGVSAPTTQTLKCVMTGTTLEAFINGVSKVTATDSAIASGRPGMRQHDNTATPTPATSAMIDDFESTDANAPPPRLSLIGGGLF